MGKFCPITRWLSYFKKLLLQPYCPHWFEVISNYEGQYTVSDLEQLSENLSFNESCIHLSVSLGK